MFSSRLLSLRVLSLKGSTPYTRVHRGRTRFTSSRVCTFVQVSQVKRIVPFLLTSLTEDTRTPTGFVMTRALPRFLNDKCLRL